MKNGGVSRENHDSYVELPTVEAGEITRNKRYSLQMRSSTAAGEDDDDDYDPYMYGKQKNGISFWAAVMHTFIAAASPTLMNMPSAFGDVGYVVGFAGSFAVVLFYANCMHTLLSVEYTLCRRMRKPNLAYAEVIYYAFMNGPKKLRCLADSARLLVYVDFLCIWGGGNVINALLASENVKCVYDYLFDADVNVRQVMLCLSIPLIALCWIPNLKLLAVCSTIANALNISCVAIILCASFNGISASTLAERAAIGHASRIPVFLGVILITMNATGIIMPLKNEMKKPASLSSKFGVLNAAYLPVSFLYALFGVTCYLKYGANVKENVVLNMPDNHFGKWVVGLFATSIIFTYPLMSYVAFDVVWNNILKDKVRKDSHTYVIKKYCCRTLVAAASIAVAFVVPDVALFVSLTGNVGVSLDSVILPALADLLVGEYGGTGKRSFTTRFCKNIIYIVLGVVLCVCGLSDSLTTLFRRHF